ncbi:MAG: 30S ribosomal protein S5 [Planctomycetes bacterium]|nr:30S ribosomal protein S5 [Planctomycetota bacterium]
MKTEIQYLDHREAQEIDLGDRESQVVVRINRSAAVVKGGRRFSFSALVVVGNRNGTVGIGYGKARDVPSAVEKAVKDGRKHLMHVRRVDKTIPHQMEGQFGASRVRIIPAAPGTGIIAGAATRAVLELAGIRDVLTKAYGSTNPINLTKATFDALAQLRSRDEVEELRGVKL